MLTEKAHHDFFVVATLICVDFSSLHVAYVLYMSVYNSTAFD